MVRPTIPDDQRRDRPLAVRLTTAERMTVEARAAQLGLPVADYARQALLTGRVVQRPGQLEASAIVAVNRVGVLLNQLAAVANRSGDTRHLDELTGALAAIERAVDQLSAAVPDEAP